MSELRPNLHASSSEQWRNLKPLAKDMRQAPTEAEAVMWEHLRNRKVAGIKFRRQHAIGGFIVDFACLKHHLIIEIDGSVHDTPEQKAYDTSRQQHLENLGYKILRFTNDDVFNRATHITAQITTIVKP